MDVEFKLTSYGERLHIARVDSTVTSRGFGERAVEILAVLARRASSRMISAEIGAAAREDMRRRRKFFSKCGLVRDGKDADRYTRTI